MRIAVLGAGHIGWATAGHLAMEGHDVRLWGRSWGRLAGLVQRAGGDSPGPGRLKVDGTLGSAEVELELVTDRIDTAVDQVELAVVALPAFAQVEVATAAGRALPKDAAVLLSPGNFAGPFVGPVLSAGAPDLVVCETPTPPYAARQVGEDGIRIVACANELPLAAYPATRTGEALERLAPLYPRARAASDVLDVALLNLTPVVHPALMVCNVSSIERHERFDIHSEGTTPGVRRIVGQVDSERIAVRRALGYDEPHSPIAEYYDPDAVGQGIWGGAGAQTSESRLWQERVTIDSRYLDEDGPYGLALIADLATVTDVATPTAGAVLHLASLIRGEDLRRPRRGVRAAAGTDAVTIAGLRERLRLGGV